MDASAFQLIKNIEQCSLPKLSNNFDECEDCPEYNIRKSDLDQNFSLVLKALEELVAKKNSRLSSKVLSSILILYKELQSDGPWNTEKSKEYSCELNWHFKLFYKTTIENVLKRKLMFNTQQVFDECLERLNQKLTLHEFKKYPSLIEVYCMLLQDIKVYNVVLNPLKIIPISLLLMEDYVIINKTKGLKCCSSLLRCLTDNDFKDGNYYEVVYGSLKKAFMEKDIEVTKLVLECFTELYKSLPSDVKISKTDDLYASVLEQLHCESNLYRKAALFKFLTALVKIHGVNCVNRKSFQNIICDNIDLCCNEDIEEVLFHHILEALEVWIKHCWCVLQLQTDKKLLSILCKFLYVCKNEQIAERIMILIVTLINLSLQDDRNQMVKSLEKSSNIKGEEFQKRINVIKKNITIVN